MSRCSAGGKYFARGIRCLISLEEVKSLWIRDKANLLKRPSIDRINGGHYKLENCRFIEFRENASRLRGGRGVCFDISAKKWRAYLKRKFIGNFKTRQDAVLARANYINKNYNEN